MEKPIVSIIVPVYNTEKYLARCLNSITNQSFKSIEIVIVNDGSTDNSLDIINSFASKYNNIVIISQKNKGLAEARRSGVLAARGTYITHVDSDDRIPENAIELLYEKCIEFNLDFAKGVPYVYYSDNYRELYQHIKSGLFTGKEFMDYVTRADDGIPSWGSLSKREIWLKDVYPPKEMRLLSEDLFMSFKLAIHIKRAGIFNDLPSYYYYINPNTLSNQNPFSADQKRWKVFYNETRAFFEKNNLLNEYEEKIRIHETDKFAFRIRPIDTSDNWYKSLIKYNASRFPPKYKFLHFLIKYPKICNFIVNTNRKRKQIIRNLRTKVYQIKKKTNEG